MIQSNSIEKLLDGIEGVKWENIKNVIQLKRGKRVVRSQLEESGEYAVYQNSLVPLGYYTESNVESNTAFIVTAGAAGDIGYSVDTFWAADDVYYCTTPEYINSKYLYYFLLTQRHKISSQVRRASIPRLSKSAIEQLVIPIPSLQTQTKIVSILDTFSKLTQESSQELAQELVSRKKQYDYYRDKLLQFEGKQVDLSLLGDIGHFTYGYAAKAQEAGDARFVRITDINNDGKLKKSDPKYVDTSDKNDKYLLRKNDLLMARTGATYGKTMIFEQDYPAIYAGFLIKLSLDYEIINPRYYWHFAQSGLFWAQANKLVSGGGQPQFNANALKQVRLPIPYPNDAKRSLSEQKRIVMALDKLDKLMSSIKEELSIEITLRQKQYDYYLELLFNFPKPEDVET
ncbi:restriction endonuclease subunit S [Vibrio artabrorum]|uniref:restriction endonuclease subunit S n=1 Tax=Vibrio artabrorum TaxID=446374 RepID=UPI00354FFE9E